MPPLDLNANLIHIECQTWRPVHRHDGRDSICECGLTFFEHKFMPVPLINNKPMTCKPWCASIVKLGDASCNCKEPLQITMATPMRTYEQCKEWRGANVNAYICTCGLNWWAHTLDARRGYIDKKAYDAKFKAEPAMSNEEAIAWLKLMGRTREARISKIQDLLKNAKADDMKTQDRLMLEGLLDILNEEVLEEVAQDAVKYVQTYKPCPMCGEDMEAERKDMCALCVEMMLHDADNQNHKTNKAMDEVSFVDPANGSIIVG